MKKKLVGIVVFMLVTTTVVSATNIDLKKNIQTIASRDILSFNNKIETYQPVDFNWGMFNWGVDQKQTKTDRYGITLYPPDTNAQSFTPTKDKLTAVSLYIFRFGAPPEPVQITVSIRDNLSGSDLATKTIDTSVVKINKSTWVLFDFEDIPVTPGNKYYIVCQGTAGNPTNAYCWLYSFNDTYPRGDAWYKANEGSSWIQWPNGPQSPKDFCFKTYFRKPLDIPVPNQSNEISNEKTIAVYAQPFSLQFHRDQTPIVQPTDITSSQNRNPSVVGTDAQVTTFTEADSHPWVEVDNNGNPIVVYDHDTGLGYHEIYLQRSLDGGKTWPADQRYYLAGSENWSVINPVIELVDNGTRAEVSFQVEQQPDPCYYKADLYEIDDPTTWVLAPLYLDTNYSSWCGQTTVDIVGNRNLIISFISDSIPSSCNNTWYIIGATDMDNDSTYTGLYWYYTGQNMGYSHPTVAAGTRYLYAASQFTSPSQDLVGICWCLKENPTFGNWSSFTITHTGYHITNPDLAASGEYAYLAVQTDEKGNNDILCYNWAGKVWKRHVVVNSTDDEMYPSITAVGKTVMCTFVKSGNLYMVKSIDGGITWGAPLQINEPVAQIIGEYRCANVEGPYSVWMDNRNANADVYADVIPMPWVAFKKCSGGLGCSVEIANVGTGDATTVEWNMHVGGGMKGLINKTTNGTIDIAAGKSGKVKSGLFLGLGKILIAATVGGGMLEKEGKHFLFFSIVK